MMPYVIFLKFMCLLYYKLCVYDIVSVFLLYVVSKTIGYQEHILIKNQNVHMHVTTS